MKKTALTILVIVIGINFAKSQQQGQFSQYMLNYYLLNPAVAGSDNDINVKTSYRGQWVGLEGAPVNYYFSGNSVLGKITSNSKRSAKPKHSLGGIFNGQQLGPFQRNGVYASYAYHYPLNDETYFSVGVSVGGLSYQINTNNLAFDGGGNSDVAAQNISNQFKPDANGGLFLYNKKFFAGLSSMQLLRNNLDFSALSTEKGYMNRHYYLFGGYHIDLNSDLVLVPSILLKSVVPTSFQLDINAKLKYQNRYWAGISYRKQDAVVALVGLMINDMIEVGYSYDVTTSSLRIGSKGTHEILLGARIKRKMSIICPSDYW